MSDEPSAQSGHRAWHPWLAAAIVCAVLILSNAPTPLYVHWQSELHFSPSTLTKLFSIYVLSLLATLALAGQLSDRLGTRMVLLPGLAAGMVACLLFASAHSVPLLLIARLLAGVSVGAAITAGLAFVVELGDPSRARQTALLASTAVSLGAALGPLVSGIVASFAERQIHFVFIVEALLLFVAALLFIRLPSRPRAVGFQLSDLHLPSVPRANRAHLAVGVASFGSALSATAFILSLGPSVLSELTGVRNPFVAGGMACIMFAAGSVIQPLTKSLSFRTVFVLSAVLLAIAMAGVGAAVKLNAPVPLLLAAICAGGAYGLAQLGGLTLIARAVPAQRRGEANALLNIGGYVPAGLMPVLTGVLADKVGLATAANCFAVFVAATGIAACAFIFRLIDRIEQPALAQ